MMDIEAGKHETDYVQANDEFHNNPEDNDEYHDDIPHWTFAEIAISGLAAITVGVSIAAMVISYNPFVTIACVFGLLVPPFTALQERKMTDIKAMQENNETMERELVNLKHENNRLTGENKKLETSVDNLQDLTAVFGEIRVMKDASLDVLEKNLKESQKTLAKMEENKLAIVLDNIISIVSAADEDQNYILSDNELDVVITNIEKINKVQIDSVKVKKLVKDSGNSFDAVINLVKNVLDNDPHTGPEDKVIIIL